MRLCTVHQNDTVHHSSNKTTSVRRLLGCDSSARPWRMSSLSCGTRCDLRHSEGRRLSTVDSHRFSDLDRIKSAAQRTTGRDAVFRFVPQQTGGTAHRRERAGFPVCTATNWWCSPAISDRSRENTNVQLQERNRERKKNLPPHCSTLTTSTPPPHVARTRIFCKAVPRAPQKAATLRGQRCGERIVNGPHIWFGAPAWRPKGAKETERAILR